MNSLQIVFLAVCALVAISNAQQQKIPDPVPILKQISKQNDDGSYSYGYEGGDGSFKIETKYPDGTVQGKYGYVDENGKLREVEYGASSKRGFEPQGNDINVPPPTLSENSPGPLPDGEDDDGQYREDPRIYDSKEYRSNIQSQRPAARRPTYQPVRHSFQQPTRQYQEEEPAQQSYTTSQQPAQQSYSTLQQPAQQSYNTYQQPARQTFSGFLQPTRQTFSNYQQPTFQNSVFDNQPKYSGVQQTLPRFQQQPQYQTYQQPQYQSYQQPQPQYQSYQQPQSQYPSYNFHPSVNNVDIGTGSYSISYTGR